MRLAGLIFISALSLSGASAQAQDRDLVPERRLVMTADTDFFGSDLDALFDTTIESCSSACLATAECRAMTFNARSRACFLKTDVTEEQPYDRAMSGRVLTADPQVIARASRRADELALLRDEDLDAAFALAAGLARMHVTGGRSSDEILAAVEQARRGGDVAGAMRLQGAALNLTDAAADWTEYAELLLAYADTGDVDRMQIAQRALSAAVNAYLRSDSAAVQTSALFTLARAFEAAGRGRDMIPALRLAQGIQPRDEAAALLGVAVGKYGFRIEEHTVDSDSAVARICATFAGALDVAGVDYAPFVALTDPRLAVESDANRICISGLEHGRRYAVTFRAGLPAADGEKLAKDVTIQAYVRDRQPAVRFPGRAYILPRAAESGIPVETVNAPHLSLSLWSVSDRNLVAAFREDFVGRPLDRWTAEYFTSQYAARVWSGEADTAPSETNRDVTTRLPLDQVLRDLGPGIYALQAAVAGADPDRIAAATQWFVISDIGFTTMQGADGLHVFARSLNDASAKAGATVTLVSRANAVLAIAETDAEGYAGFAAALVSGSGGQAPALVTVESGEDFSYLSLTEPEFDLSDRGVAGRPAAPAVDVFMATDRGAYRAGEVVNATILARDAEVAAIEGLPLTVRLVRPDGVEYARTVAPDAGAGGRAVSFDLAETAARGTWRMEARAEETGPVLASQSFLVEDFLPERIAFDLSMAEGPQSLGARAEIGIDARYLFGAPGADLPIEGDFRIRSVAELADYPGFRFGRHDSEFPIYYDYLPDPGATDAMGRASVKFRLPELGPEAARPLSVRYGIRLTEGSGRPVERSIERLVLPDSPVIGIKPAFKDGVSPQGTPAEFQLIAVGSDGAPAAMKVRWRLNRLERRYQWYSLYGQWNWDVSTVRTRADEGTAEIGGDPVRIEGRVDWGEYELVVEAADGGSSVSSLAFYAGWYVPADAASTPDTLELALDQREYRTGDTAHVRIVPRAAGVALISVVSNRLIAMKAVPVAEGENTVDLPVTDDWGAGAYVTASVLRPMDVAAGRTPARALGLSYAPVDPGPRRLATTIEVAPEADPRGPLPVAVRVEGIAPGETAQVTIAAVDAGILNLTGYGAPDPEGHYFGQQRLGMAIRDVYGRLIDGQSGAMGQVRSGGDAGTVRLQAPPPTEELVAYFSGPLTVGPDGYARTQFALPSFNGTVRVMAVAWSRSAVGQAQQEVLVRDPVVVTASLPRFLAPGDESALRLEIVHATGPAGRVGLDVSAQGLGLGTAPSGLDLAERGKAALSVPITAPAEETDATIRVALTTPDGRQLVKSLTVPVRANDPEALRQHQFALAPGATFTLDDDVFSDFLPGTGRATLALGPMARFNAPGLLASLDRYPYGCTEQVTSKAMPLLYFEQMATAMDSAGDPAGIRQRVQEAIGQVLVNQAPGGAFGLWSPEAGDLWLDAFVTDFLSRARSQGHEVPDAAFRNALDNLRNQLNYAPEFDEGGGPYAYAMMVLAREGAAATGDLRYYADVRAAAFDTPIAAAQLGAALALYGDQRRADAMFRQAAEILSRNQTLAGTGQEAQIWRSDYGTGLRDAAAVLALAAEAGSQAVPQEAIGQSVAAHLSSQRLSTQEATWALLAAHALAASDTGARFAVNGAPLTGPLVRMAADTPDNGPAQIIANAGTAEATLTLSVFGVPAAPEPAGGNGYAITRSWYDLDGKPADTSSVAQGTRLVTVIEVTPLGGGEARLMVDDPLPAGFEIDNPNLIRGGDIAALDWLEPIESPRTVEFRQDRFLAAVDWTSSRPFRLAYIVRAVSPGNYRLPAATVEDMYRPDFRARSDEGRVIVSD
ncbi:alpha-2-macroglobulin family protein [Defluviimonas sp. WL0002]|uniref:Alpha-2-macroglobulin family protein n=1 Tax=Albidovulum marisflavi TaxID=2984159 RepID=A0ABT2Z8T6_9RHOB|nr:alpha-2-macroglobulin family protein [Defluviimonas sp. WL0002]MCV2867506.1 alpha-2-macroglobulin family protein [Defluviimonas sp. WL0002]